MHIKINCPNCQNEVIIINDKHKCNIDCGYIFNVFSSEKEACVFRDSQPSIEPRHIIYNDYWIVAYCYEKVERPSIYTLTKLISEETISNLFRGFSNIMKAPLQIYERMKTDPSRIFIPQEILLKGGSEFYDPFCQKVHESSKGKSECSQYILRQVEQMFFNNIKSPVFYYCWLGQRQMFIPIVINNFLYGVIVCGKWHRENNKADEDHIKKGIEAASHKLGIEYNFDSIPSFNEMEIIQKKKEVFSIKEQLESLGSSSFRTIRYERDWDFIRETDAIFSTTPITTEKLLFGRLNLILERLTEFCDFESCFLFISENGNLNKITMKCQYPKNIIPDGKTLVSNNIVTDLSTINNYFTREPQNAGPIYDLIKKYFSNPIKLFGYIPLDVLDDKGFLVLINRRIGSGNRVSMTTMDFIHRFVGRLVININNFLSLIKLQKAEYQRQELITLTVHTLNQYMDGLLADSKLLERYIEKDEDVPLEKYINTAQEISERVSSLASKTKTFYYSTTINAGKAIDFRFDKSFSILELLRKCKNDYYFFAKKRHISVEIEEPCKELPDIIGDEEKIEIVFSNLFHNAIKFSHYDRFVKIGIRYLDKEKNIIVSISNFGFGIPSDEKDLIFQSFRRSAIKDPKRPIPGTGLGLMIAKNIVDAHNGSINVKSMRGNREYTSKELNEETNWVGFNTTFSVNLFINPNLNKEQS